VSLPADDEGHNDEQVGSSSPYMGTHIYVRMTHIWSCDHKHLATMALGCITNTVQARPCCGFV
jgi:hypothetical protein